MARGSNASPDEISQFLKTTSNFVVRRKTADTSRQKEKAFLVCQNLVTIINKIITNIQNKGLEKVKLKLLSSFQCDLNIIFVV